MKTQKKNFTRTLGLILMLALVLTVFTACDLFGTGTEGKTDTPTSAPSGAPTSADTEAETDALPPASDVIIRVGGMTGPTSIGMAKLMADNETSGKYLFTVVPTADKLSPDLIQGKLDVAAVPANLAATLFNRTNGKIQAVAINTLGVLSILERGNSIATLDDLRGKTIYATGKGAVPEYTLRYLLTENGIDPDTDVNIIWKTEPAEIVAHLKSDVGAADIAMLPQPFVTAAITQVSDLHIALELNDEWEALENGTDYVTGVLVVRREFAEQHPDALASFLNEYAASIDFVDKNAETAAPWVESYVGIKAGVAKKAIPYCNLTYMDGADMKAALGGYLGVLHSMNPAAVGGALPTDDFYYGR